MTIETKPLNGPFGVEIMGVQNAAHVTDQQFRVIESALDTHGLVLLRSQNFTEAEHLSFSRRFGELDTHWLTHYQRPEHPEILVVSNVIENGANIGIADAGRFWHSDLSYTNLPSRGSLLHAREIPMGENGPLGDTLFANVANAYKALPEDLKQRIDGAKAVFNLKRRHERIAREDKKVRGVSLAEVSSLDDVVRDIVVRHPITGHPVLYVNEAHTVRVVGRDEEESTSLLEQLFAHCRRSEFVYRHQWQVHDLIIWDNYATQHLAVNDYALPQRRVMYRTTLKGRPFPVA